MRGFIELTVEVSGMKVLIPVPSIIVYQFKENGAEVHVAGMEENIFFKAKESYDEVKALIAAAQKPEPEPEQKRKFIILNQLNKGPLSVCVNDFLKAVTKENRTFVMLKSGGVYVSESVYDIIDFIEEAQEE